MKKIKLSNGKYALVDNDDFPRLSNHSWHTDRSGYVKRMHNYKDKSSSIYMHRVILGASKGKEVDHINRNKLDNRKHNLRFCTHSQNMMNLNVQSSSKSGCRGVTWRKDMNMWRVRFIKDKKVYHLGNFFSVKEAKKAWMTEYKKHSL